MKATLEYKGVRYTVSIVPSFPYMWEEGNYGCDCNRSTFIQQQCDPAFPLMECGETIALASLGDREVGDSILYCLYDDWVDATVSNS